VKQSMIVHDQFSPRAIPHKQLRVYGSFLLFSATLAIVSAAGCNKKESVPETVVTVQAEKPELGSITEHIVVDAVLSPLAQAALSPKITAPIKHFDVQRGSRVKAGQLLATLENKDLVAAALDNQGSYSAAQAAYETATQAQAPEDLQKARLELAQATANLKLNESIVASRKQLFAEGAIPGRDLDTATAALVQAQAAYDMAKQHFDSMQRVSHRAALKSAAGQLTSAEGKLRGAEAQVSYSEIRSPIDGVVTDRSLFAGETAPAGTPLITVMDTSALIAKVHLAQAVAQHLTAGDEASITVPGRESTVPAKISLISPALDPGSNTVEVWLRIDNKKGELKAGTPVRASVAGRSVANALKVPSAAVLTAQDNSKSVMVMGANGTSHRKPVEVGIHDDSDVQIVSGLSPNDVVITGGAYGLEDGTKIKIGAAGDDDEKGKPTADKGGDDK
jgi:HlyD family secretion protein